MLSLKGESDCMTLITPIVDTSKELEDTGGIFTFSLYVILCVAAYPELPLNFPLPET